MATANPRTPAFELALAELIDSYRSKATKSEILATLASQRDRVDHDWVDPQTEPMPDKPLDPA